MSSHESRGEGHADGERPAALGPGYEASDARVAPLVVFLAGLAVACALAFLAMRGLFRRLDHSARLADRPGHPLAAPQVPPAPRLQADPPAEWARVRAAQAAELERTEWIDRAAGRVRVPISRALELVLSEGLPTRPGAALATDGHGARERDGAQPDSPSASSEGGH